MGKLSVWVWIFSFFYPMVAFSQEEEEITVGMDFCSSYVWRGIRLGKGPAVQPSVEFTKGSFTVGAWGSCCLSDEEALETDLYASLGFGSGFSMGVTNYYYPGTSFFNIRNNAIEVNGAVTSGIFSLEAFCVVNQGAGSEGGDLYFEAGISAGKVNFFAGAGSGWHTTSGRFNACNLGLSFSKEIPITTNLALPLTGSLVLNPDSRQLLVVALISL